MDTAQLSRFNEAVGRIYDAALDPHLWPEVVREIAAVQGCDKALLFTPLHPPSQGGITFPVGISESAMQEWADRYVGHDVWSQALRDRGMFVEGAVHTDEDLVPHEEFLQSVWYREFLSRIGIARVCAGIAFGPASTSFLLPTALSIYRGVSDRAFGQSEREIHRLIVPHLSRSLGIMFRLRDGELNVASSLAALDRLASGVLLFGPGREVVFANRIARRSLAEEDGLRLRATRQGKTFLVVERADAQRVLDAALDQCLDPDAVEVMHFCRALGCKRPSGRAAYALNVSALSEQNEFGSGPERPRAIAFLTDPAEPVKIDEELLRKLYGLTPAECRLVRELCAGEPLTTAARQLSVSENTAKTQLRHIFEKTGTHRQAQLVKLVVSLASNVR